MDNRVIIGLAVGSLVFSEVAATKERLGYPNDPHTHFEIAETPVIDVTSPIFASGSQKSDVRYRVHLKPSPAEANQAADKAQWIDLIGIPNSGTQLMYRRFLDVDELLSLLKTQFGLPSLQLDAIRASVMKGEENEIGGHVAALFLPEVSLRNLGMNFRPTW